MPVTVLSFSWVQFSSHNKPKRKFYYCFRFTDKKTEAPKEWFIYKNVPELGASLVAQQVENLPAMWEAPIWFLVRTILWRRDRLPTPVFLGVPSCSDGKEFTCNVGNLGSTPGLERSTGGGHGNPLQYSCLVTPHVQRSLVGYSPWGHRESDMRSDLRAHTPNHCVKWPFKRPRTIHPTQCIPPSHSLPLIHLHSQLDVCFSTCSAVAAA